MVLGWLGLFYGVVAVGVLLVSFSFSPQAIEQGAPWGPLGLDAGSCIGCALCGLSRAFSLFSHGQFLTGWDMNALVAVAWPATWLVAVLGPFAFVRRHRSS